MKISNKRAQERTPAPDGFSTTVSGLREGSAKEVSNTIAEVPKVITQPNQMTFSGAHPGSDATRVSLPPQQIINK